MKQKIKEIFTPSNNLTILIFVILIMLLSIILSGCNELNNDNNNVEIDKFLGTWITDYIPENHKIIDIPIDENDFGIYNLSFKLTFINLSNEYKFDDSYINFISSTYGDGTYNIVDGKLVMNWINKKVTHSFDYSFSNDNKQLTIIDKEGNSAIYLKQ